MLNGDDRSSKKDDGSEQMRGGKKHSGEQSARMLRIGDERNDAIGGERRVGGNVKGDAGGRRRREPHEARRRDATRSDGTRAESPETQECFKGALDCGGRGGGGGRGMGGRGGRSTPCVYAKVQRRKRGREAERAMEMPAFERDRRGNGHGNVETRREQKLRTERRGDGAAAKTLAPRSNSWGRCRTKGDREGDRWGVGDDE